MLSNQLCETTQNIQSLLISPAFTLSMARKSRGVSNLTGNSVSIFPPLSPPGLSIVRNCGTSQSEYEGMCFMMRRKKRKGEKEGILTRWWGVTRRASRVSGHNPRPLMPIVITPHYEFWYQFHSWVFEIGYIVCTKSTQSLQVSKFQK